MGKIAYIALLVWPLAFAQIAPPRGDSAESGRQLAAGAEAAKPVVASAETPKFKQGASGTRVIRVENANGKDNDTARLTNRILVHVREFDQWLGDEGKVGSIILYLDDRPLPSVKAYSTGPAIDSDRILAFDLIPNEDQPQEFEEWRRTLVSARRSNDRVHLSVGLTDRDPLPSDVFLTLKRAKGGYKALIWLGLLAAVVLVLLAAWKKDLLRDAGPPPEGGGKRTFSLGRTQMAIWFCLILIGWAYISLTTMSAAHISDSILALMGISAAAGVVAVAVDRRKGGMASLPPDQGRTEGFFNDIFSDEHGWSFHRLQMFLWTAALGSYFLVSVFKYLVMPEFDTKMLWLMGISAGTYLGFKAPEKLPSQG